MRLKSSWIIAAAITLVILAQLQLHWHVAAFLRPLSWPPSSPHLAGFAGQNSAVGAGRRRRRLRAVVGVQTGFNAPDALPRYNYQLRREQLRRTWFPDATERKRWHHLMPLP